MQPIFSKLGLAITFSPTGKALLKESARLKKLFNSELLLIHIGTKNLATEGLMRSVLSEAGIQEDEVKLIWSKGDPAKEILRISKEEKVDLLVMGALERERVFVYYAGSVARKIMRESHCSVLALIAPSENPKGFDKFYISVDYTASSEITAKKAYSFAKLEEAHEIGLIRDFYVPGLPMIVADAGKIEETNIIRQNWLEEEKNKLKIFASEMNIKDPNVKMYCLYGKEGWEAANFAREKKADIFAIPGPKKRLKLLDRIFTHELEFIFENLPSNILLIKDSDQ